MKKLGLKKKGDGDDDSSRKGLFGSKSRDKSPVPPSQNPYAMAPPDPYTQAKMRAGLVPAQPGAAPPSGGPGGYRQASPQGGYGSMGQPPPPPGYPRGSSYGSEQNGYGADNRYGPPPPGHMGGGYAPPQYGAQGGYGAERTAGNPYAAISQTSGTSNYSRPGGYGGLGRTTSNETATTDANRDELFGGARERLQQRTTGGGPPGYEYKADGDSGQEPSYGAYGNQELTAEQEEEQDVEALKQDIRGMKQQTVSSTRNALQAAQQAEETGRNTLARLGAQGESIHNTLRNLNLAENHTMTAEGKAAELKKLNRSMFAVHVSNPFTGDRRTQRQDEEFMQRYEKEREERDRATQAAIQSKTSLNSTFKAVDKPSRPGPAEDKGLSNRLLYEFEADEEDKRVETEIDDNIDLLSAAAQRLKLLAHATGAEIESQIDQIGGITTKAEKLDGKFELNTDRLKRIR